MATLEVTTTPGGETRLLALRVTPEQEVAIYAFFQINGWTIITEEIPKHCESCQRALNGEEVEIKCQVCQKAINGEQEQTDTTVQQTVQEVNQNNDNSQSLAVFQQGRKIVLVGNTMTMTKSQPNTNNQETIVIEQAPMSPQKAVQPVPPKIYNINNSAENRPYKCDDCGKHFRKKTHVIAHMKYHSGEALPKCDICGKEFLYKHNLISHASIHSGERPFQCNICPKTFRRKDDLQIHMRTHTGERPYKCDICGKCFTTQNQLPKHRRTHTGEKPYQCSICNKCFRTKPHLEKHHRTHSGERPYLCGECGRAFTQNAHLIAHQRIHTGEKPFQCDECDKAFKESKTLKKHKLIHLNGMPYSCHICGKGFLRQQNLEVHMCVHSDDEPKYKRKLRQKRELMERLKAEEEIAQMGDTIIEEEVSGLEQMEMVKDETSSINTDKVNEVNGNVMVEASEDPAANSIASSLLTLVEMITSAEHEAARAGEVQQVSGEISTTAVPTTTGTVISAASIPSNPNTENIIIQPQEVNASQQGGQIQYQQGVNIIQGQIDTENTHGQGDLQQQNIIITQVEGNDEQIIESVTSQFGDGQTYVVEYVEQDS